jgi:hypothetical protein
MKKLLLTLLFCLFSFSANAKVTVFDFPLSNSHVDVIKGQLYVYCKDLDEGADDKELYAKSIYWLEKLHAKKEVIEISKINKIESEVIQASMYFIAKVERGEYAPKISRRDVQMWYYIGQRVVVVKNKNKWSLKVP